MSGDLTCPTCAGKRTGDWFCPGCSGSGRRRPTLAEWDALEDDRDLLETDLNRFERLYDIQHERLTERAGKAESERDRYREALERILALAPKIAPGAFEEHGIARRALEER